MYIATEFFIVQLVLLFFVFVYIDTVFGCKMLFFLLNIISLVVIIIKTIDTVWTMKSKIAIHKLILKLIPIELNVKIWYFSLYWL
jgi:hypothetical protein